LSLDFPGQGCYQAGASVRAFSSARSRTCRIILSIHVASRTCVGKSRDAFTGDELVLYFGGFGAA